MPDSEPEEFSLAELPGQAEGALEVIDDFTGLAADVGEFVSGDDVKRLASKASKIAKGLGFVGAAFGIVFDVVQMLDEDYQDPTDQLLEGLGALGTKIDDLQDHIDRQFEALKRDLTITNWSITVSEDVNYVQFAIKRMSDYNEAVTRWKESVSQSDDPTPPPSRELEVATDELRKYESQDLLVALANVKAASTGQSEQQLVGLLELFSPNQTRVTRSFASTVSLLAQGSDAYCLLLYLDFMEGYERSDSPEFEQRAEEELARARLHTERDCGPLVEAVRAEYLRLTSGYVWVLGTRTIQQVSSGRYLDAHQSASHDYRAVTRAGITDTRKWRISLLAEGEYSIQQISSGQNLDAHQSASHDFGAVTRAGMTDTRKWKITPLDDNRQYSIQQISSGRNLDAHQSESHDYKAVTREGITDTRRWSIYDEGGTDEGWTAIRLGLDSEE